MIFILKPGETDFHQVVIAAMFKPVLLGWVHDLHFPQEAILDHRPIQRYSSVLPSIGAAHWSTPPMRAAFSVFWSALNPANYAKCLAWREFQPQASSLCNLVRPKNDNGTLGVKGFIPIFILTVAGQLLESYRPSANLHAASLSPSLPLV